MFSREFAFTHIHVDAHGIRRDLKESVRLGTITWSENGKTKNTS